MTDNKKHSKTTPVFRIKPEGSNSNRATIKHIGYLPENEKLCDEIVELDPSIQPNKETYGKNTIPIKSIGNFELTGSIYRCNIGGAHIVASRRYPLMYLNIHYDRVMVSGALFQIIISLDMDWNEKKEIKNNAKYVNLTYSGKWYRHIDCDDELKEHYEKYLIDMLEKDAQEYLHNTILTREDDEIKEYIKEHRVFYDELINDTKVEYRSISQTRDMLIKLCQSEKFYKFLQIALKCREIYRRKQSGITDDDIYVVPKKITKMKNIRDEMINSGELLLD
jgi:hypothetical protein